MVKRALVPEQLQGANEHMKMSPGLISGNHVFLTGMTGADLQGDMPTDPKAQFCNAFTKIELILDEAGLTFVSVVEMTRFHIGLRGHFELFQSVRLEFFKEPYPAWTAVEVAGLRREEAFVEIRVIAAIE